MESNLSVLSEKDLAFLDKNLENITFKVTDLSDESLIDDLALIRLAIDETGPSSEKITALVLKYLEILDDLCLKAMLDDNDDEFEEKMEKIALLKEVIGVK